MHLHVTVGPKYMFISIALQCPSAELQMTAGALKTMRPRT